MISKSQFVTEDQVLRIEMAVQVIHKNFHFIIVSFNIVNGSHIL